MAIILSSGRLRVEGKDNGWDVFCPQCGNKTHVNYRVPGLDGAPTDFVAQGGVINGPWECEQPFGGTAEIRDQDGNVVVEAVPTREKCGYVITSPVQLQAV